MSRVRTRLLLGAGMLLAMTAALAAGEASIDAMETLSFRAPKEKGRAEGVPGHQGQAVRFLFENESRGAFFTRSLRPGAEWDSAAGFSFWVKGDGSDSLGGLEFIYNEDYAVRYDYAFSLRSTEWMKVTVPWRDLVPVLPGPNSRPLDPVKGNRPSRLSQLWVGKWWYWRDYPAHSFALDDLRLEPAIALDTADYRPSGEPLARVRAKLRAGQPITLVTMGDSLTDFRHWANREVSWVRRLEKQLGEQYRSKVTVVNPAIGGTQLRQNLVLMPRWLAQAPEPDLVTVCFGYNDWDAGMRGEQFYETCRDAVDRIRRATHGKADVLLLTTLPSVERRTTMAELAEAVRRAARDRSAGLADPEKAFLTREQARPERLYARDNVHLGPDGHELVANTVLEALGVRR